MHVEKEDLRRNLGSMWQGKDGAAILHQYRQYMQPEGTLRTLPTRSEDLPKLAIQVYVKAYLDWFAGTTHPTLSRGAGRNSLSSMDFPSSIVSPAHSVGYIERNQKTFLARLGSEWASIIIVDILSTS